MTWAEVDAWAEGQAAKHLEFAAAWRDRGTAFAIWAAEYNEARAAVLLADIKRRMGAAKAAGETTGRQES